MIWLEMRCERRGRADVDGCWSDGNHGPFDQAPSETQQGVAKGYKDLSDQALKAGWKKIKCEGWVCPSCLTNT